MTRVLLWLFNKMMTIELFRYMRMYKYGEKNNGKRS